jgi:hypothetical protein
VTCTRSGPRSAGPPPPPHPPHPRPLQHTTHIHTNHDSSMRLYERVIMVYGSFDTVRCVWCRYKRASAPSRVASVCAPQTSILHEFIGGWTYIAGCSCVGRGAAACGGGPRDASPDHPTATPQDLEGRRSGKRAWADEGLCDSIICAGSHKHHRLNTHKYKVHTYKHNQMYTYIHISIVRTCGQSERSSSVRSAHRSASERRPTDVRPVRPGHTGTEKGTRTVVRSLINELKRAWHDLLCRNDGPS